MADQGLNSSTKRALVFDPHRPYPPQTGTHHGELMVLHALRELGYEISIFGSTLATDLPWERGSVDYLRDEFGAEVYLYRHDWIDALFSQRQSILRPMSWDKYNPPWFLDKFRELFHKLNPDLVIIEYAWWGKLAIGKEFRRAIRILVSHDSLTINERMQQAVRPYLPVPLDPQGVSPSILEEDFFKRLHLEDEVAEAEEYRIYDQYDGVIAVSAYDEQMIRKHTSKTYVQQIPVTSPIKRIQNTYNGSPVLVISNYSLNIQGYAYFAVKVLPTVLQKCPHFNLRVIGGACDKVRPTQGIQLLGYISDLKPIYAKSRFAICPIIGGTGMQVKIVEAMAHGVPVIALKNIAHSSPIQHEINGLIANDAAEFAEYVIQLSHDKALCRKLGKAARQTIEEKFSPKVQVKGWEEAIAKAQANRERMFIAPKLRETIQVDLSSLAKTKASRGEVSHQPKISVITPSLNNASFIKDCIESVLAQDYRHFEHIIIDGGSKDGTVEILRQYPHLKWVSEPDRGEAEALNKGLRMATGDIIGWLNADDWYERDAFKKVIQRMSSQPNCHIVYGQAVFVDAQGKRIALKKPSPQISLGLLLRWWEAWVHPHQPSMFYSRALIERVGPFNQGLHFSIDYEYWLRSISHYRFDHIDEVLSYVRWREGSKSMDTEAEQIKSHWRVGLSFLQNLGGAEQAEFWRDYFLYLYTHRSDKPRNLWALEGLAQALREKGRDEEAEFHQRVFHNRRSKASTENTFTEIGLSLALLQMGEKEGAFSRFRRLAAQSQTKELTQSCLREIAATSDQPEGVKGQILTVLDQFAEQRKVDYMKGKEVRKNALLWQAPVFDPSGYADDARHLIRHISRKWKVKVEAIGRSSEVFLSQMVDSERDLFTRLMNTPLKESYIQIIQAPAYAFRRDPKAIYAIGRTVFETDSLPGDWVAKCNEMNEIWVPTIFNVETFQKAGVTVPIYAVPEGVDTDLFRPGLTPLPIPGRRRFAFLSVFEWIHRKGWDILLRAWAKAFTPDDDVCLILRTYLPNVTDKPDVQVQVESRINHFLESELGLSRDAVAPIIVMGTQVPQQDMPRLYAAADAYVMPSRGEGWGRPYIEAMACGLPTIGTRWGGNMAFMNDSNSYLVDIEGLVKVDDRMEFPFYRGHRWAQPSAEHLRDLMRYVFANRKSSSEKGRQARQDVVEKWGWDNAASLVLQRLEVISHRPTTHQPIAIRWEGSLFIHHSLALINRELSLRLLERDNVELSLTPYEPDQFSPEVDPRFARLAARVKAPLSRPADVHLRHQWPPNFNPPPEGHWVMIQPWEYGAIPQDWVEPINTMVDELWVPSQFVRSCYIQSGVNPGKIFVIPNGVNFDLFNPQAPPWKLRTKKRFKFLFVGGTIWRKGIDILLEAYRQSFTAQDDVCLVIKDMGQDSFYRGQGAGELIKEIQKDKDAPEILYLKDILPEDKMAGLYTACNCLVHPYRGEGFGLPVAEALACGLPVIVTKGGPCDEFCPSECVYWVPSQRRGIKVKLKTAGKPWVLEPSTEVLAQRLREIYSQQEEARKRGLESAEKVREILGWDRSVELILKRLSDLKGKPILRKEGGLRMSVLRERKAIEFMRMGDQHREAGENELAERFYQKSLKNNPYNQEALKKLGALLLEVNRFEEAIPLYRRLTEMEPWSVENLQSLGECLFRTERMEEARSVLQKGLELDPTNVQIQSDLGVVFWQEGDLEEALNHLQGALQIAPEDPDTILNLALICYQVGMYEEAAGLLERYSGLQSPDADVHLCLGDCYFHMERRDLAKKEFELALSLDPELKEAEKRLQELGG